MTDLLPFARDMAACLCALEVRLVCPGDDLVQALIPEDFHALIPAETVGSQIGGYLARLEPGQVYLISGIFELPYCIIPVPVRGGWLIAGPCLQETLSEGRIRSMLHGLRLSGEMVTKLISYCRWQPILPREKLHQFGILLARHVPQLPEPIRYQYDAYRWNRKESAALEARKIHPYRLDTVSGEIVRQIEKLKTLDQVAQFYAHILRRYCELALETDCAHLDPFSRQAVVYIKTHLTDNLTVKGTARAMMVNANYLSGKFHRAVGMTFTDFVNSQRTAQAASLLRSTNMQIQEIAAAVGYNNTSYFTKQFLRFYQTTPRAYRQQAALIE